MTTRRNDVDVVRCLALVSMYVAHVAPVAGPAHVLELSEYLTMPLFALLIGVGAQLGERGVVRSGRTHWWRSLVVRAASLVGLGLLLDRAGSQVAIVLVFLGVLVVVAGPLSRLPVAAVAAAGVVCLVLTPMLREAAVRSLVLDGSWWPEVQAFLWAGEPYRLGSMLVYTSLGILLTRWWLGGRPRTVTLAVVGSVALVAAAAMLAAEQAGRLDLVPYSGTYAETVLDALLVTGALGLGLVCGRLPGAAISLAAAAGAMTLTLYCLQVLWLAFDVRVLHPGMRDDSWTNLAVLVLGSLALAAAWRRAVPRGPWHRGPLEGAVGLLAGRSSTVIDRNGARRDGNPRA